MALLKLGGAVLLLLFFSPLFTEATDNGYLKEELEALQVIWAEWNKSTPNLDSNLAGWNSSQVYPCDGYFENAFTTPNWRGIECLGIIFNGTEYKLVTGLSLHNASIVGTIPKAIGNLTFLSRLELTGNPNLTGPPEIQDSYLQTLDLHDNAFNGSLPYLQRYILNADLSGNEFVGEFLSQIQNWQQLQTLNLARNHFNDSNLTNAFINMTQLVSLDLSTNKLTGPLPNLTTCRKLQSLKLAYNNLTGAFPLSSYVSTSDNNFLSVLDLSGNQLTGSATGWNGSDFTSLEELYLDNTGISGTLDVTQLIASGLVQSKSVNGSGRLRTLSIMNSNISDVIYTNEGIDNITTLIRLQGNPYCRKDADDGTRCFCEQNCKNQGSMSNKKVILIATVASTLSVFFIIGVAVSAFLYRTRRYKRYLLLQVQQKFEEFDVKPTIFSFNELRVATRDFHPDMKLGEGGYGAVYKGVFPNKNTVAIKRLFVKDTQDIGDFLNEVVLITGMKHRNLVNLKGYCLREHQRLLVYEYVDNYDINQILLRGEHKTPLGWVVRLNICLGVARGLHYLHSLAHPRIIHRDIKASNILLDTNFEAKIADFGLALLFPDEKSLIMTLHVAGTRGYVAPEYASFGQVSDKIDVFSFGILCLEVLSGRQNIDKTRPLEEVYLSNWAWKLHGEDRLMELVDPTIVLQDDEKSEMQRLINIALLCSQHEAEQRPTMARVVTMLQNDTESEMVMLKASNSGTSKPQELDSMHLLAFGGNNSGLPTLKEEDKSTLSFNIGSSRRALGHGGRKGEELQLSEMRAQ